MVDGRWPKFFDGRNTVAPVDASRCCQLRYGVELRLTTVGLIRGPVHIPKGHGPRSGARNQGLAAMVRPHPVSPDPGEIEVRMGQPEPQETSEHGIHGHFQDYGPR